MLIPETVLQVGCMRLTGYLALVHRPDIRELCYIGYWISSCDFNKIVAETVVQVVLDLPDIWALCIGWTGCGLFSLHISEITVLLVRIHSSKTQG